MTSHKSVTSSACITINLSSVRYTNVLSLEGPGCEPGTFSSYSFAAPPFFQPRTCLFQTPISKFFPQLIWFDWNISLFPLLRCLGPFSSKDNVIINSGKSFCASRDKIWVESGSPPEVGRKRERVCLDVFSSVRERKRERESLCDTEVFRWACVYMWVDGQVWVDGREWVI